MSHEFPLETTSARTLRKTPGGPRPSGRRIPRLVLSLLQCMLVIVLSGCSDPGLSDLESRDPHKRRVTVAKLTDQTVLAQLAIKDPDWDVRQIAIRGLADGAMLADLAVKAPDGAVRAAAVGKLTDQAVLAQVAVNDSSEWVRRSAQDRLNHVRSPKPK